ncbi:class I adenylate-forming enzyme family protein [Chachezhania antarctica]|uniref:class I adenylate-forming enzyme family protein n=1 Tax=Chachezhania antarctica TaxID=2340860 RepID=UPI000EB085C9|nr:class I adenylate-forming enzyme family protein [Chachezhania antarctica]|tara:strand:+ start:3217 stop:4758 length:1542 start_codon:yes stop_codon:yes gene_type:complete
MVSLFNAGAPAPCPTPFNMAAHVLGRADAAPDKTALSILGPDGPGDCSFATLQAMVRGTGTGLLNAGLNPGDIVVMRLGNTVDFPVAYLGALAAGLVPVPTSPQLTEPEVAKILAELSPGAVLHDPDVATAPYHHTIPLDRLQAMRHAARCDWHMGDPDRLGYIVYTSGTSGKPRAVAHAHRAIWARQMMFDGWYGLTARDRLLHAGAFNWTFTLGTGLMDPWTAGATALIPAPGTDLSALPGLLSDHDATLVAAAPGVYRKILQGQDRLALPSLRHGLTAGEKLSRPLLEAWKAATGTELYEAYGMSECSTFISSSPAHPVNPDTLGRPQAGRKVAILPGGDSTVTDPLPHGSAGLIAVHRSDPGLMLGYLNDPENTAARFRGDWFLTGDLGAMGEDGEISYLGRDDDMMNAGGFRVSPLEVEAALAAHPGIEAVGVTDVEIKADTRIIVAFYTGPDPLDENALSDYASGRLARYKMPRAFVHLSELPSGANGKLSRRALRGLFPGPGTARD